jgi:hypothetical protein
MSRRRRKILFAHYTPPVIYTITDTAGDILTASNGDTLTTG